MNLEELLFSYSKQQGMQLELDKDGICRVLIEDSYLVAFEKAEERKGFFIYSVAAIVLPDQEERLFKQALIDSLFGHKTNLCSFGYDSHTRSLILYRFVQEEGCDLLLFSQLITQFYQALKNWTEQLDQPEEKEREDESGEQANTPLSSPQTMRIFYG